MLGLFFDEFFLEVESIVIYLKEFRLSNLFSLLKLLMKLLLGIILVALIIKLFSFIPRVFQNLQSNINDNIINILWFFLWLLYGGFLLFGCGFLLFGLREITIELFEASQERRKIKKLTSIFHSRASKIVSRQQVAIGFNSLKTNWGRLKYIEFLQNQKIKPQGEWPDGNLPNINNDEASTLLAKLEEKWLGLDR